LQCVAVFFQEVTTTRIVLEESGCRMGKQEGAALKYSWKEAGVTR